MDARRFALAAGVLVIACSALAPAGSPGQGAQSAAAVAGQPRFVNAQVETRAAGAGFAANLSRLVAAQRSAGWIGYSVPAKPGDLTCDSSRPQRVYLEGRPARTVGEAPQAERDISILLRAEEGKLQRIRFFSGDCELDAGGLPVIWLTGVAGAESVAALGGLLRGDGQASPNSALLAIALHRDPSAIEQLIRLVREDTGLAVR